MYNSTDYQSLHNRAKAGLADAAPKEFENEGSIFGTLLQVEVIRDAVRTLMSIKGSGLATDLLLCIAAEAQQVKVARRPDIGLDWATFFECADDQKMHAFIHQWLASERE